MSFHYSNPKWFDEHQKLLMVGEDKKARELKLKMLPKVLFRYQPINENVLDALDKKAVWMSRMDYLNDPYKCSIFLDYNKYKSNFFEAPNFMENFETIHKIAISDAEIVLIRSSDDMYEQYRAVCEQKGLIIKKTKEVEEEVKHLWEEKTAKLRSGLMLSSFSEHNHSTVMWAHYAANHSGICIQYDLTQDLNVAAQMFPVFYSKEMFDMTPAIPGAHVHSTLLISSIRKSIEWNYEREWRLLFPVDDPSKEAGGYCQCPTPTAIYLGSKFHKSGSNYEAILKIAEIQRIKLYDMIVHKSEFKMIAVNK
jgi:hypothetical protein